MTTVERPADDWPDYCCAILQTPTEQLILEERPASARLAAGHWTCFGGGRLPSESPEECVRRELREELGVEFPDLRFRLRLVSTRRVIAWFYLVEVDPAQPFEHQEEGYSVVRVQRRQLDPASQGVANIEPREALLTPHFMPSPWQRVTPWHQAALLAHWSGRELARVTES